MVLLSDFTSLRVSLNLFLPRLLVIFIDVSNSSILFSLKNSYCWRSVISCRIECHQRSTRPFGMESMLFSLSHHMQKISLRTCHICHDHWHFLFSSDPYCRPIRMGRYSKCWNGACFLPSFPSLRMDSTYIFPSNNRYVFPKVLVTSFSKDVKKKHVYLSEDC